MTSTRELFIQTTGELIERQGFHATGLNQIIQESGAPKGSLYYHFPGGKEELTAESLKNAGKIIEDRIREHLTFFEDAAVAVQEFIQKIGFHVVRSGFRAGGPITTVAMETASTSEHLRKTCDEIYLSWQAAFADRLEQDQLSKEQARQLAAVIISSIEGATILCRTNRSTTALDDVAQAMHDLIHLVKTSG